jgi:hypothetical protein
MTKFAFFCCISPRNEKNAPSRKKDITTKLSFSQKEEKSFFFSLNGFAQKFWEEKKRE